jgi:voltage-gated potassium channel
VLHRWCGFRFDAEAASPPTTLPSSTPAASRLPTKSCTTPASTLRLPPSQYTVELLGDDPDAGDLIRLCVQLYVPDGKEVATVTTPEGSGAAPPPVHFSHATNVLLGKPLTSLRAARLIATVTIAVTVIAGVLMRFTDARQFPNIGDGLWWGIQTVTTVGYGDRVPTSPGGRLVAALVMLIGIGFLTVVTAAVTSTFIETAQRRAAGTASDALSAKLDQIVARLDAIDAGLANIRGHGRDGPQ